jgi:hypothetical protein
MRRAKKYLKKLKGGRYNTNEYTLTQKEKNKAKSLRKKYKDYILVEVIDG